MDTLDREAIALEHQRLHDEKEAQRPDWHKRITEAAIRRIRAESIWMYSLGTDREESAKREYDHLSYLLDDLVRGYLTKFLDTTS